MRKVSRSSADRVGRPSPKSLPTRSPKQLLADLTGDIKYLRLKLDLGEKLAPSELARLEAAKAAAVNEGGGEG